MQKGQMRFEPNVNVVIESGGTEYRTPIVEIKNLNSFRAVRRAVDYESKRQVEAWQEDHGYQRGQSPNENRGWNDDKGVTEFQRPKEEAQDYRYFPDPDLVPVEISDEMLEEIRARLPELPIPRRARFVDQYGLSAGDAETIVGHRETADLFEKVIGAGGPPDVVSRQFVNVYLRLAHEREVEVPDLGIDAERMAELAIITADGTVNNTSADRLAELMLSRKESPRKLAQELGLIQVHDPTATARWIDEAFASNPQAVRDALENPKKAKAAVGFLRGRVMRISSGQADPKLVGKLIEQRLAEMPPNG
jgi:aspartyl-tRNA(Asn)/glutamyl-tRNA(Gln) amidotransferase subunit B